MSTAVSSSTALPHPDHSGQAAALAELALARESGDDRRLRAAENGVTIAFLSLATALARRYRQRSIDSDDLEQLARLGLVKAVRRWSPDKGDGFVQFAVPTITGEIKRYFRDQGTSIRMPRWLHDIKQLSSAVAEELEQQLGRPPRDAELAAAVGVEVGQLRAQQEAATACRPVSFDPPGNFEWVANLPHPSAEQELDHLDDRLMLQQAIGELNPRERRVLGLSFFGERSQDQIGRAIGVSQMQVSRIRRTVINKLRVRLTA